MLHEVVLFAAVFAVSAITPGADTMLLFGRSLASGARAAVPLAVGITAGKLVLLTLAAAGVTAAASALGPLFLAVKLLGAAYLIWLGVKLWRRHPQPTTPPRSGPATTPVRGAGTGLALALSNPQAILFYAAILPAVIDPASGPLLYLALAATLCLIMVLIATLYIGLGARARRAAANPSARRRTDQVAGTLLIASGVVVATR